MINNEGSNLSLQRINTTEMVQYWVNSGKWPKLYVEQITSVSTDKLSQQPSVTPPKVVPTSRVCKLPQTTTGINLQTPGRAIRARQTFETSKKNTPNNKFNQKPIPTLINNENKSTRKPSDLKINDKPCTKNTTQEGTKMFKSTTCTKYFGRAITSSSKTSDYEMKFNTRKTFDKTSLDCYKEDYEQIKMLIKLIKSDMLLSNETIKLLHINIIRFVEKIAWKAMDIAEEKDKTVMNDNEMDEAFVYFISKLSPRQFTSSPASFVLKGKVPTSSGTGDVTTLCQSFFKRLVNEALSRYEIPTNMSGRLVTTLQKMALTFVCLVVTRAVEQAQLECHTKDYNDEVNSAIKTFWHSVT